jgi:cation:H+ antiporter
MPKHASIINMPILPIVWLLGGVVGMWFSSSLAIKAIEHIAHSLHMPRLFLAIFILGAATSLPEMSIVANSLYIDQPHITLGNLIGGQVLLLLGVIPLLTICTGQLFFQHKIRGVKLLLFLAGLTLPALMMLDQRWQWNDGLISLIIYAVVMIAFAREVSWSEKMYAHLHTPHPLTIRFHTLLRLLVGVTGVMLSSFFLVKSLTYFQQWLHADSFYVSFIISTLGTNLPELTLAIQATWKGVKDLALGDYLGSALFNTLLLGIVGLWVGNSATPIEIPMWPISLLFLFGSLLFWFFARSHARLSRREGLILLTLYVVMLGLTTVLEIKI